jgi:hypothetical protein
MSAPPRAALSLLRLLCRRERRVEVGECPEQVIHEHMGLSEGWEESVRTSV